MWRNRADHNVDTKGTLKKDIDSEDQEQTGNLYGTAALILLWTVLALAAIWALIQFFN